MAAGHPCANVDLQAFVANSAMGGGNGNDVWGWTDPLTAREYALMGLTTGTSFLDVTDPANPLFLGHLPTHSVNSTWRGIKVYAEHAFVVSEAAGHGMQVFDLKQLRNVPAPPATFAETAHYSGFATAHTLAINEQTGFAYAAGSDTCAGGLHIVNIQNPANPVMAGCFSADGYSHETQCVIYQGPDSAHLGREICFNSNEDTLTIVNVTDKSNPAQLTRATYSESGYTHQGWLTEDHAFFLLNDESDETNLGANTRTHIWDVRDLDAPQRIAIYEAAVRSIDHNLYVRGNFVYEANYRSGLRILDLSQVAQGRLREVAYFDTFPADDTAAFNSLWSNYPFFPSGTILGSDIEQGLFVLRHDLNGTGMGLPNYSQAAAPASVTVSAGQTATYTLTFEPQNAFASAITPACSKLPLRASCSFSPSSVTPQGGPATATLRISTSSSSATLSPGGAPRFAWPILGLVLLAGVLGLANAGVSGSAARETNSRRRRAALSALFPLVVCCGLLAACGGGGSPVAAPPPSLTTPRGTYTITVESSAGQIIRRTQITLVVQ